MTLTYTPNIYKCTCCGELKTECDYYTESYTGKRTNQCKVCINVKRAVERHKAKHGKFVSKEKIRGMENPDYVLADWRDAMIHFGGTCAFCNKPEGRAAKDKMDRDHLIAISKGGKTIRNNIIPACRKCNRGRGNKAWKEWFMEQDFYSEKQAARIQTWAEQTIK